MGEHCNQRTAHTGFAENCMVRGFHTVHMCYQHRRGWVCSVGDTPNISHQCYRTPTGYCIECGVMMVRPPHLCPECGRIGWQLLRRLDRVYWYRDSEGHQWPIHEDYV